MKRTVAYVLVAVVMGFSCKSVAAPGDYGWYDSTRPAWLDQNLTSTNGDFSVWYCDDTHHSTPHAGTADTDGDGLPDSWENTHIGNLGSGSGNDPDTDGSSNLAEYQDGSWPHINFFRPLDTIDSGLNGAGENVIARDLVDTLLFQQGKYAEWGFNAPSGLPLGVFVRYTPWGGWGNVDPLWIGSHRYTDMTDADRRSTATHELFHNVQKAYSDVPRDTKWFIEGSARMSQDFLHLDMDTMGDSRYCGEVEGFLANPEGADLFSRSYSAVFFWKYLVEQTGYSIVGQPWAGFDAMDRFMKSSKDKEGAAAVSAYLNDLPADHEWYRATFDHFFGTWVTALYTRQFDPSSMTDHYYYRDEQENLPDTLLRPVNIQNAAFNAGTGAYTPENIPLNGVVSYGDTNAATWTQSLQKWRSRYYAFKPDPSARFIIVWADGKTSQRNYYAIVTSAGDDVKDLSFNYGEDLQRAYFNNGLDEVGVVIGSLNGTAEYDLMVWSLSDFQLEITWPHTSEKETVRVAETGDAPSTFEVHVAVRAYKQTTPDEDFYVDGLQPDLFEVKVDATNDAPVLSGHQMGEEYWLVCQAPDLAAGEYDLRVDLLTESDIERQALVYAERPHVDRMIVIDRSGSMGSELMGNNEKMMAAKSGGRLHTDLLTTDDQMGLVSFGGDLDGVEDDATLHKQLSPASNAYKGQVKTSIDNDIPDDPSKFEHTAMGQGIKKAYEQLSTRGMASNDWRVALLTDGIEDIEPYWDSAAVSGVVVNSKVKIDAIALGNGSHESLLRRIASETEGDYFQVPVPAGAGLAGAGLAGAGLAEVDPVVENKVANVYRMINEREMSYNRIWSEEGVVNGSTTIPVTVYDGMANLVLTVNWPSVSGLDIELRDSEGALLGPDYTSRTHELYHMPTGAEKWTLDLTSTKSVPYLVVLTGQGEILSKLFFVEVDGSDTVGAVMKVCLSLLRRRRPVTDAAVVVRVTAPSGHVSELAMFDDGDHGDMTAGDGIYSRDYRLTPWPGTYRAQVVAQGEEEKRPYRIEENGYFLMAFDQETDDRDYDGMPTEWEIRYGLDPAKPDDTEDKDDDGVLNGKEFLNGGNPADDDTDNGGTQDGSELDHGMNMLDFADDLIAPPSSFSANQQPTDAVDPTFKAPASGENLLYWSLGDNYKTVDLYRGTDPALPFVQIAADIPAQNRPHSDKGLVNGKRYYYRMVAMTGGGIRTRMSDPLEATPKADNLQPWGGIQIEGPGVIADTNVMLRLRATPDTTEMRVANEGSFTGKPWKPFATNKVWQIAGKEGINFVYAQFKDGHDNVSLASVDSVSYQHDSDADGLGDAWELQWFRSLGRTGTGDFDGDGLIDLDEFLRQLNPDSDDTDGDGMGDGWEERHGLNPRLDDADWDADGDGAGNNGERIAGTDPRDRHQFFGIERDPEDVGDQFSFRWHGVTGRLYSVYSAHELVAGSWTVDPALQDMPGTGGPMAVTEPVDVGEGIKFYRLGVRMAP